LLFKFSVQVNSDKRKSLHYNALFVGFLNFLSSLGVSGLLRIYFIHGTAHGVYFWQTVMVKVRARYTRFFRLQV
jgi:hypothetical protein